MSGYTIHVWNWADNTGCRWENAELEVNSQVGHFLGFALQK